MMDSVTQDLLGDNRNDLVKTAKAKYPSLTDEAAEQMAQVMLGVAVAFPDADEARAMSLVQLLLDAEAKAGKQWAVDVLTTIVNEVFRPAYNKAVEAGVDPVPVLMAMCGLSRTDARKAAKEFKNEDGAAA